MLIGAGNKKFGGIQNKDGENRREMLCRLNREEARERSFVCWTRRFTLMSYFVVLPKFFYSMNLFMHLGWIEISWSTAIYIRLFVIMNQSSICDLNSSFCKFVPPKERIVGLLSRWEKEIMIITKEKEYHDHGWFVCLHVRLFFFRCLFCVVMACAGHSLTRKYEEKGMYFNGETEKEKVFNVFITFICSSSKYYCSSSKQYENYEVFFRMKGKMRDKEENLGTRE